MRITNIARLAMAVVIGCCMLLTSNLQQLHAQQTETDERDLMLQGEYLGSLAGQEDFHVGCQIIALGDGKFALVAFGGGLPGEGGESTGGEASPETPVEGEWADGRIVFQGEDGNGILDDDGLKIYHGPVDDESALIATLERVERKSPTLGAEPPEGALVLFDGSNADAFDNGEISDGLLQATNCSSKETFGDHHLHIEFRTPFMPRARGQGRGNSGVYVQSRYEVQVLDSFGLSGASNECGGIYRVSEPAVNACFPPTAWQTYDIEFTAAKYADGEKTENARITVRHNGIVIHDDVELPNHTPGRHAEGPEPDGLFLQDHGNPVEFRNIWVVKK